MKLFYYTEIEVKSQEEKEQILRKPGHSFNLESVIMTYPEKEGLAVVLNRNADKLNPIDYQYKINPQTKQKEPVKITKFETTSEPIVVVLKDTQEIAEFLKLTGGPESIAEILQG
jgi:hypothetical protein